MSISKVVINLVEGLSLRYLIEKTTLRKVSTFVYGLIFYQILKFCNKKVKTRPVNGHIDTEKSKRSTTTYLHNFRENVRLCSHINFMLRF